MTNYEKVLQDMTLDRMTALLANDDFCSGTPTGDGFECDVSEGMGCRQCLRNWLIQEAE